jgi:hypothetical protein
MFLHRNETWSLIPREEHHKTSQTVRYSKRNFSPKYVKCWIHYKLTGAVIRSSKRKAQIHFKFHSSSCPFYEAKRKLDKNYYLLRYEMHTNQEVQRRHWRWHTVYFKWKLQVDGGIMELWDNITSPQLQIMSKMCNVNPAWSIKQAHLVRLLG